MVSIFLLLSLILRALEFVILIWVLMSWLPGAQQSALGQFLGMIAGFILDPLRRFIPRTGFIDFTPLAGLLLLQAAQVGLQAIARMI
ncbi:YggT family protein [Weissella cibaria]|uniref:YggT family protein n=1 Tax=Weissella cibaria TaxID=137591 RepID=UPI00223B0BF5|nr:YggT family protein [Weissella cibaria]MCT0020759.1 YggT family protein [Weissella cibaria]